MNDDQEAIWQAHEQADGNWVGFEGHRHFWPLHEDATLCGHIVDPENDPPGLFEMPVCEACNAAGLEQGIDITQGVHIQIAPPDPAEPAPEA